MDGATPTATKMATARGVVMSMGMHMHAHSHTLRNSMGDFESVAANMAMAAAPATAM